MRWWDRHNTIIDIPITDREKWKEEKHHWSQPIFKSSRADSITPQGLGLVLRGSRVLPVEPRLGSLPLSLWFCSLTPRRCPPPDPFVCLKASMCLQLNSFISLFPICRILEV